jgi:hypothetical protein
MVPSALGAAKRIGVGHHGARTVGEHRTALALVHQQLEGGAQLGPGTGRCQQPRLHLAPGVFQAEVAAGAGGIAARRHIGAAQLGQLIHQGAAAGIGGQIAAIEQQIGPWRQGGAPAAHLGRPLLQGGGRDRLLA